MVWLGRIIATTGGAMPENIHALDDVSSDELPAARAPAPVEP